MVPERRPRLGDAERGAIFVLVGLVLLVNVGLRLVTDVSPWVRIGVSLAVGVVLAGAVVTLMGRRRR